jgi:hypothetical protein
MPERFFDFFAQAVEDFAYTVQASARNNFIQKRTSEHTHKRAGNAVSGAIGSNDSREIAKLFQPIKIAAHDVARFVEYKVFAQNIFSHKRGRQYGLLNTLRIVDACHNFLALFKSVVALALPIFLPKSITFAENIFKYINRV